MELGPDFYSELRPTEGSPVLLGTVLAGRDTYKFTRHESHWGEREVIEFSDTDRRHSDRSALAAWFPGEETSGGERLLDAVLLRDFVGAPRATSPEGVLGLLFDWPPPWALCRPGGTGVEDDRVDAFDAERGLKLGLRVDRGMWVLDHVEFVASHVAMDDWWAARGYGSCDPVGTVLENGRYRLARRSGD